MTKLGNSTLSFHLFSWFYFQSNSKPDFPPCCCCWSADAAWLELFYWIRFCLIFPQLSRARWAGQTWGPGNSPPVCNISLFADPSDLITGLLQINIKISQIACLLFVTWRNLNQYQLTVEQLNFYFIALYLSAKQICGSWCCPCVCSLAMLNTGAGRQIWQ